MFSTIKAYIWAAGAALLAGLLIAVKFFSAKAKRMEQERDEAEAQSDFNAEVIILDEKVRKKFNSRRAEALNEINKGTVPSHLSKPND